MNWIMGLLFKVFSPVSLQRQAQTFDSDGAEAGVKLLAAAHGARGDMLVMGAYGRSAWREFLLGGATRHVITHLDLPVLMGH